MAEMSRERILEMLRFEPATGQFFWIKPPRCHPEVLGNEAGCARPGKNGKSYWYIKMDGGLFKRSHLVFMLRHGRFPFPCADHRNGNSLDDCPDNIREATIQQNNWNHHKRAKRSPLPMGVRKMGRRFQACLAHNGHMNYLGTFATPDEARAVYLLKRKECFGEFA